MSELEQVSSSDIGHIQVLSCSDSSLFGWLIAAILAKALRHTGVKVNHSIVYQTKSDVSVGYDSKNGNGLTLKPDFLLTLTKLGLTESTLRAHASANTYLVDEFLNWQSDNARALVSFTPTGVNFDGVRFVHFWSWVNTLDSEPTQFNAYSFNSVCADLGRFTHPVSDTRSVLSTLEYGLTVDSAQLHSLLREAALALGVEEQLCVDKIKTTANMFFDCRATVDDSNFKEGPQKEGDVNSPGSTSSAYVLPVSHSLKLQTTSCLETNQQTTSNLATQYCALDDGYIVSRHVGSQYEHQIFFDSETSDINRLSEQLSPLLAMNDEILAIALRDECKSIGNSVQPNWRLKEASNQVVSLSQRGVFNMMPDGGLGFAGKMVEQWLKRMPKQTNSKLLMQHFNHSMQAYFDSVYELTLLPFYISASHDSPFWQRISTLKQTDKIQHFIRLFRETGVFPTYEHYPQELDYYENMLVCLGCQPSAFDPLVYGMLSSSTLTRLEQLQNQLINTAKGLPQSH